MWRAQGRTRCLWGGYRMQGRCDPPSQKEPGLGLAHTGILLSQERRGFGGLLRRKIWLRVEKQQGRLLAWREDNLGEEETW